MTYKQCIIDKCLNTLPADSKHEACALCRGSLYYWNKKRPAEIVERRRKLTMYNGRLDHFYGTKGNKVKP